MNNTYRTDPSVRARRTGNKPWSNRAPNGFVLPNRQPVHRWTDAAEQIPKKVADLSPAAAPRRPTASKWLRFAKPTPNRRPTAAKRTPVRHRASIPGLPSPQISEKNRGSVTNRALPDSHGFVFQFAPIRVHLRLGILSHHLTLTSPHTHLTTIRRSRPQPPKWLRFAKSRRFPETHPRKHPSPNPR